MKIPDHGTIKFRHFNRADKVGLIKKANIDINQLEQKVIYLELNLSVKSISYPYYFSNQIAIQTKQ